MPVNYVDPLQPDVGIDPDGFIKIEPAVTRQAVVSAAARAIVAQWKDGGAGHELAGDLLVALEAIISRVDAIIDVGTYAEVDDLFRELGVRGASR